MRSTSSFAAAEGQAARSGWGSVLDVGVWVVEGRECVGGLDQNSRTSIPFWVCGAIALLAPATTALILRRKRASEIDGCRPGLEVGGVK